RKIVGDISEGFVGHRKDGLELERLHEALRLGIVVWVAASAHRADETMAEQRLPIALRGVLRTALAVVNAPWRRLSPLDGRVQRSQLSMAPRFSSKVAPQNSPVWRVGDQPFG